MSLLESINNLSLIENGLAHIEFELSCKNASMFRVAREFHLILYRSMIQALRGSSNISITGRQSKDRSYWYSYDEIEWRKIHKTPIEGCKYAWRFSAPKMSYEPPVIDKRNAQLTFDEYLIPFYDALAMIQTECFMHKFVDSKEVKLSDREMQLFEWLHEKIRNEYEHFIPKSYSAPLQDLINLSILSLCTSKELLFDSRNVYPFDEYKHLTNIFESVNAKLATM
jgi:hypothetical protein